MTALDLEGIFGDGGLLAQRFEGYAPRQGQVMMAEAVERVVAEGGQLVVEAPTGTGKSLAYLAPAALDHARNGRRTLVVTGNIALQEQLVGKDLPLLAKLLPGNLTFALLKGRRNYLCLRQLAKSRKEGLVSRHDSPEDRELLGRLNAWACETEHGDVSELPFEPPQELWARFSTHPDECPGKQCMRHSACFVNQARERAASAAVVVSNYHLLFANLLVHEATGEDRVLPPFDVVVLDEAHSAADIARDFFGYRVSHAGLRRLVPPLELLGAHTLARQLRRAAQDFCDALGDLYRSKAYSVRLRRPGAVCCDEIVGLLDKAEKECHKGAAVTNEQASHSLACNATRCGDTARRIREALGLTDPNAVSFIELDRNGRGVLCSKPIEVGERIRIGLFDRVHASVVTSATLSTAGKFALVETELGLRPTARLVVSSPFDYAERALLVVPGDLPDPTDRAWGPAVARRVAEIVKLAQGRTLALFTSYRSLDRAHALLRRSSYPVLRQGQQPRTALVKAFADDTGAVLLGTDSFWTGIDVPGETLSCVVIDRLPFTNPDDPVLDAIRQHDRQWFMNRCLPAAVLTFKQGFGRLIRSVDDRGVVVVLDRRLVSKPYGRIFLGSLPPVRRSDQLEDVARFLRADSAAGEGRGA
jgi:ATP-dependent DNA helicase DinG